MKGMRKLSKDSREQLCSHEGFPEEAAEKSASLPSEAEGRACVSKFGHVLAAC